MTTPVRGGYWFGALPEVGVGVDAFDFEPDVRSQRVTATAAVRGEILDEDIDVTVGHPTRIPSANVPAGVVALDLGEYRFTYFRPEVDSGGLTYKADLSTHHLVFGPSLRF